MVKKTVHYVDSTNVVWITFSNPEVANYHTYISYDLTSLIGEVGGILGLTLGVSALTFFELLLNCIRYYLYKNFNIKICLSLRWRRRGHHIVLPVP